MYAYYEPYWLNNDELEHFGIKGMKWGIRRYQNPDGTLTEAGKNRLEKYKTKETKRIDKKRNDYQKIVDRDIARHLKKNKPRKPGYYDEMVDNYKKELKAIKKLKYSDMVKELKIKRLDDLNKMFGVPGGAIGGAIEGALGNTADQRIQKMRLEIYNELNKK